MKYRSPLRLRDQLRMFLAEKALGLALRLAPARTNEGQDLIKALHEYFTLAIGRQQSEMQMQDLRDDLERRRRQ